MPVRHWFFAALMFWSTLLVAQNGAGAFSFGGYASAVLQDLEHRPARVKLRDLSLLLGWDFSARWHGFSELELGDALEIGANEFSVAGAEVDLERLYVDYLGSDLFNLRLGKFLTPIGRWNRVHADPLVWTVTRPLTTQAAFARHMTGLMLYGDLLAGAGELEYQFYIDDSEHLDPLRDRQLLEDEDIRLLPSGNFRHGFGGRVVWHLWWDQLQLGSSLASFRLDGRSGRKQLLGLDLLAQLGDVELSGEAVYRYSHGRGRREAGGFLQVVIPLGARWFAVLRHEIFSDANFDQVVRTYHGGLVYRPRSSLVFKLELRGGENTVPLARDGAFASVGVLF